jgi:hypothetical protein
MLRPTSKIILEVIAALIAGVVVLAGIAWWQLSQGRVSDGFLKAYVEQGISQAFGEPAQIETVEIQLDLLGRKLRAGVTGLSISGADGALRIDAPSMQAALSLPALFLGRVVVAEAEVESPQIRIVRGALASGTDTADLPAFLRNLQREPDELDPRRGLERATLTNGAMAILDEASGRAWRFPALDFTFIRDAEGFSGKGALALTLDSGVARADANLDYDRVAGESRVDLRFDRLDLVALSHAAPVLAPLEAVAAPISGSIGVYFDRALNPVQADLALRSEAGALILPALYADPLPIKSARLNGRLEPREQRIVIDEAVLALDQPTVTLRGTIATQENGTPFDLEARLDNLPLNELARYWPERLNREARAWMTTNARDGAFTRAEAKVRGTLTNREGQWRADVQELDSRLAFKDATVTYMRGLPPVNGVAGEGRIGLEEITADFSAGAIEDFRITGGNLKITDLDKRPQQMAITLEIAGPLRTALEVLAVERLQFPQKIGIEPAAVSGDAAGTLTFAFPLKKELPIESVDLRAQARVRELAVEQIMGRWPVAQGDVALDVTQAAMLVEGDAVIRGVPATVRWSENFSPAAPDRSTIDLTARLDDTARRALGLGFGAALTGETPVAVRYVTRRDQPGALSIDADFTNGEIAVPTLRIRKESAIPARGQFEARVMQDGSLLFDKINVGGEALVLQGTASLVEGRIQSFDFTRVQAGENDFAARGAVGPNGAITAEMRGAALDLRGPEEKEKPGPRESLIPDIKVPLDIRFALDRLWVAKAAPLLQARGSIRYDGNFWDAVDIDATAGEAPLAIEYLPITATERKLVIETADGGATLAALGLYENARGGKLLITGVGAPSGEGRMTTGAFEFTDFKVVRAPVFAQLLNLVSPQGIAETLSGDGIGFSRAVGEYQWASGVIVAREGRMSGPSVGLTFDGRIDLKQNAIDMKGTLVPIAGVNNIIGAVPIIGQLLTGGAGQGVLAATYRLDGEVTSPKPDVNPLSMLAPGFLRSLFFLGDTEYEAPVPEAPLIGPDADPALPDLPLAPRG